MDEHFKEMLKESAAYLDVLDDNEIGQLKNLLMKIFLNQQYKK